MAGDSIFATLHMSTNDRKMLQILLLGLQIYFSKYTFACTESINNENRLYISLKIIKNLLIAYDSNITPLPTLHTTRMFSLVLKVYFSWKKMF